VLNVKQPDANRAGEKNNRKLDQCICFETDGQTCDQDNGRNCGIGNKNAGALSFF
jgi:hypothetical protein